MFATFTILAGAIMGQVFFAVGVCLALLPLVFFKPRHIIANPALYMLIIFTYSIPAKIIYYTYLYEPSSGFDIYFLLQTDAGFLWGGLWIAAAAATGYILGYLFPRKRIPTFATQSNLVTQSLSISLWSAALVLTGCILAFLIFAVIGEHDIFGPISQKRFTSQSLGGSSRFAALDYYFYKIAALALPLSVLTAYMWVKNDSKRWAIMFAAAFIFSVYLTTFVSARAVLLLMVLQLILLSRISVSKQIWLAVPVIAIVAIVGFSASTLLRGTQYEPNLPRYSKAEQFFHKSMRGRYFMDITKVSHISEHFSGPKKHLLGSSFGGVSVTVPDNITDTLPERPQDMQGWREVWKNAPSGTVIKMPFSKYLATYVFRDPRNSVTSFTGQLFADFGYVGVLTGFLILGSLHRYLFNIITCSRVNWWSALASIMAIPLTSILLVNSGIISTITRTFTDFSVIPICIIASLTLNAISARWRRPINHN